MFVLSVPFEERGVATANGARWDAATRSTIYVGAQLPPGLTPYASPDYSWERWLEDDLNGRILPAQPSAITMTLRPHQQIAADKIAAAGARGYRGFLEADDVGVGKSLSGFAGAVQVAKQRGAQNVLIMCPKGVIPHWRRTIAAYGDHGLRICVINYDQAKKLLTVPDSAAAAARTRTKNKRIAQSGQSVVEWDIVLLDESHYIKNAGSQRSQAVARIAAYAKAASQAPFVIWMSATAGQNPTELGYLAPLFSQLTGAAKSDLKDFGQWLADQGFHVVHNARFDKWDWGVIPPDATAAEVAVIERQKAKDLDRVKVLLFEGPDAPSIRRLPTDIAGWPEIQRILHPVDLDLHQRHLYERAWTEFRGALNLARRGRDPKGGMAARLRFRQKASLIRVPGTVDLVLDMLANGHQVAVSVEFMETLDAIRDELAKAKVACAEFTGRNATTREQDRLAFQRGHRNVILFSVAEGFSLHAGEQLGDGTAATASPRTCIVHDPRYSGIASLQTEGRCHRDGRNANVYYAFAGGTVEEQIVRTLVGRVRSTKAMVGDDISTVRALEAALEATVDAGDPWSTVPASTPRVVTPNPDPSPPATGTPVPRPAQGTPPQRSAATPDAVPPRRAAVRPAAAADPFRDALAGGTARVVKRPPNPNAAAEFRKGLRGS